MRLHFLPSILFLLGSAFAQPHQHLKHLVERDVEVIKEVVEVVWEVVTTTTSSTMTVWLNGDTTLTTSILSGEPDQFFQPVVSFSTRFLTTSISAEQAAPSVTSVAVAPSSVAVAPVVVTTPPAPVVVPTTTAPAAVIATPAAGPGSGACSASSPCTGDITYYDAGLGACGTTNDGSQMVVALPHEFMGTQSNGNPYCGKSITINANQRSVVVTVEDKCMGCSGYSLDLSDAAFLALGFDLAVGRTTASWYFN